MSSTILLLALALPSPAQDCLWSAGAPIPVPRLESQTVVLDGSLVLFGGWEPGLVASTRVDAYDPQTDAWSTRQSMPTALTHAGVAVDEVTQEVWFVGGTVGNGPGDVVDQTWTYDILNDSWAAGPPLPAPRASGGAFRIGRELHFVGGIAVDRQTDEGDHWVLDLDDPAGSWIASDPLPTPRNHFATALCGGKGYILGGQFGHDIKPAEHTDIVEIWDPQAGWTTGVNLPLPRSHTEPGTIVDGDRILLVGGRVETLTQDSTASIDAFDTTTDTWSTLPALPQPLLAPAAKMINGEIIVASGEQVNGTVTPDTLRRPGGAGYPTGLRVNAGGPSLNLGEPWCADLGFIEGGTYTNQGIADIAGTDDDFLYVTERSGTNQNPTQISYQVPADDGLYLVRLHFAEIYWGAPGGGANQGGVGKRVFDVELEGQLVLNRYDIFRDVGAAAASIKEFTIEVTGGALDMNFFSYVDRPKLSAFELLPWNPTGPVIENYCSTELNSTGAASSITASNVDLVARTMDLTASNLPAEAFGFFLNSLTETDFPAFGGAPGFVCVGGAIGRGAAGGILSSGASGSFGGSVDLDMIPTPNGPVSLLPGQTWHFQAWHRDVGQGPAASSNFTDGVRVRFP